MTTDDSFENATCACSFRGGSHWGYAHLQEPPSALYASSSSSSKMASTLLKVFLKCVMKSFLFPEKFTNPRLQETLNNHGLQVAQWGCWTPLNWKEEPVTFNCKHILWAAYQSHGMEPPLFLSESRGPIPLIFSITSRAPTDCQL